LVKRSRKPLALFIKRETSENRIGPGVDRSQIVCNPVSRDLAIRIGCQDEAVISPPFASQASARSIAARLALPACANPAGRTDSSTRSVNGMLSANARASAALPSVQLLTKSTTQKSFRLNW
jgi:hypothetical protein